MADYSLENVGRCQNLSLRRVETVEKTGKGTEKGEVSVNRNKKTRSSTDTLYPNQRGKGGWEHQHKGMIETGKKQSDNSFSVKTGGQSSGT